MKLLIWFVLECKKVKLDQRFSNIIRDIAWKEGFYVDENFCGHGIGKHMHMLPQIIHTYNNSREIIEEGMVFTIEPIFAL